MEHLCCLVISTGRGGHIVITASVNGLFSGAGVGVYVTSKFALVGLAESLHADLQPFGVGVSVLCSGPLKSELFESTQQVRPAHAATGSKPLLPPGIEPLLPPRRSARHALRRSRGCSTHHSTRYPRVPAQRRRPDLVRLS